MLIPSHLRCEYLANPIGIDVLQPRFSWVLESNERSQSQSAYQLLVAASPADLAAQRDLIWDSGRVESAQSAHIAYAGPLLESGACYFWCVRVWDQDGCESAFGGPASWQMGLLSASDWQAQWIGCDVGPAGELEMRPCPYLRRTFTLDQPVARATLYATARGLYRARLNGQPVGTAVLAPDWTDYNSRIVYNTYDVTAQLQPGENALGAVIGDGWYSGYVGYVGGRAYYGAAPQFLAQLVVELADGSTLTLVTDASWRASAGPLVYSDILMGEHYDARCELAGWDLPSFDDSAWLPVAAEPNQSLLVAQYGETVQVVEYLPARTLSEPQPGVYVFDLGQNFAGWVRLQLQGPAGARVQLQYGELLNADGTVYVGNLRRAKATDTYILSGAGAERWEPHFTYHGFRYVELRGMPSPPSISTIIGCVVQSNLPLSGHFECSSPLVNQLWSNILWGQRGNFVSIPTDCPQRDERLGWMGDVLAFGPTACFNMNAAAFFTRWMTSVVDAQSPAGGFPDVAPRIVATDDGAPAWGDTGVVLPWTLYQLYGDTRIIDQHYTAMTRWMDYIYEGNPSLLRTERVNTNYGDWISYNADMPRDVLATAFWAYDAQLMSRMARAIGRTADAERYARLFTDIRQAFVEAYVRSDGRIKGDTQTGYVLALYIDLLPPDLRPLAIQHLVDDIKARDWHLSTGFVGTPFLLPTLSAVGQTDVAYRLLLQESIPSWGYMIACGATTIWERWDSLTADGEIFDPVNPTFLHPLLGPIAGMNSFNHYAFGAVGEWLYRMVAGIDVGQPGFTQIVLRPQPGGGLSSAQATYQSLHGPISSAWHIDDETFYLSVAIPANTSATLYLPGTNIDQMSEGQHPLLEAEGVCLLGQQDGATMLSLGSGSYAFAVNI